MKRNVLLFSVLVFCLFQTAFGQENAQTTTTAASSSTSAPVDTRGYLLGPGDVVTVKVLGESQFDFVAAVSEDGKIEVPFLDQPVIAMCKTEREIRSEIAKVLSKYLRSPQVNLQVTERKSRPSIIVSGEVRKPLEVTAYRQVRLLELMSAAGGVTESAGGLIQVFRNRAPICGDPEEVAEWNNQTANSEGVVSGMYSYSNLRTGTLAANPVIYPGDVIIALKAAPVYFTGEIRSAQNLQIPEGGLSLFRAIAMQGGVTKDAKTKDIKIYRKKQNSSELETFSVNFDKIQKGEQKDVMLEPYDVVEVDKAKPSILTEILRTVKGAATGGIGNIVTTGLQRSVIY